MPFNLSIIDCVCQAGERNAKGLAIDNRCEVCRFFSSTAFDWLPYDASVSEAAGCYLSVLYKDCRAAVKMLDHALLHVCDWSFDCTSSLADSVDCILVARSAIISFCIQSLSSHNVVESRDVRLHRDSISAQWSVSDCIAQLAMHCMNIRFAGTERLHVRPLSTLVDNVAFVVRVLQQHFSPAVEQACKEIIGKPDATILRQRLWAIMPKSSGRISDALRPLRRFMVGRAMRASAIFLLEKGIFPQSYLSGPIDDATYRRFLCREDVNFPRFKDFVHSCGSKHVGCDPRHVFLALSFSLSTEQLDVFFRSNDDIGLFSFAESLISRLASSSSPFRKFTCAPRESSAFLIDSALKKIIMSTHSQFSLSNCSSSRFGSGTLEDDVAHVQDISSDATGPDASAVSDSDSSSHSSQRSVVLLAVDNIRRR
jgi:hypothetical protein